VDVTGSVFIGTGAGAIYADTLLTSGAFFDRSLVPQADPFNFTSVNTVNLYTYRQFIGIDGSLINLSGGDGAGGAGGDGQSTPEPGTLLLSALGVAAVITMRQIRWGGTCRRFTLGSL
jgi:PEP-CTERM motif